MPSPSGILRCRLEQWFNGTGHERTNKHSVESDKNMEQGTLVEPYWFKVYARAGFEVCPHPEPPPPGSMGVMRSHGGDAIMYVATPECASVFGMPMGSRVLLELKNMGGWSYFDFVLKDLQEGHPDYWAQVNTYLHGYACDYAIVHAGIADPGLTKWVWKRIKKQEDPLPPFWIEIVKKDAGTVMDALERANEVRWSIDNITDHIPIELRDYNPHDLLPKQGFPCFYCAYADACVQASPNLSIVGGTNHATG